MDCSVLTHRVLRWLENGRPARILNLFNEVCNLTDDEGDVVSLVTTSVGPGPFSMIVDTGFTKDLDADHPVAIDPASRTINIGPLTISTDRTNIWNPRPEWPALKTSSSINLTNQPPLEKGIENPLQQLIKGIKSENAAEIHSGAYRLAGLGKGLTPTGDDVLMGVLYGLWVWHPQREWMRLITETAVPRTTTLSAAFLRTAAEGEATIHWHDLVNGRVNAVNQILAIGQTSGHDVWAGFTRAGHHLS